MNVQERSTACEGLRFFHRVIRHPSPRFTPTMFISGAFQTMDSWARFAEAFAPHTTVLLVDPPGMGRSDTLPPDFGIDFLAGCLEQVLDENGIGRANLIAASYGTPSAYHLAATRPDRVDRIVLAGTMKELPGHLRTRIAGTVEMARKGMREALAHECADGMLCDDPERAIEKRKLAARVLRSGIVRMSDADLLNYAANTERLLNHEPLDLSIRIHGPQALVFTGEHDVFTYPDACREVASAFARVWFTTIRRADHLFHLERLDAVVSLILGFSARTLGGQATDEWHTLEALNAPMPPGPQNRSCPHSSPSEPRVHDVVVDRTESVTEPEGGCGSARKERARGTRPYPAMRCRPWSAACGREGCPCPVRGPRGHGGSRRTTGGRNGFASMERRAVEIGARLEIDSGPGRGTTLTRDFHPHVPALSVTRSGLVSRIAALGRMIMRGGARARGAGLPGTGHELQGRRPQPPG